MVQKPPPVEGLCWTPIPESDGVSVCVRHVQGVKAVPVGPQHHVPLPHLRRPAQAHQGGKWRPRIEAGTLCCPHDVVREAGSCENCKCQSLHQPTDYLFQTRFDAMKFKAVYQDFSNFCPRPTLYSHGYTGAHTCN